MRQAIRFEVRQLLRDRAVVAGVLLLLAAGIVGLFHGRTIVDHQRATLATRGDRQAAQHRAILDLQPATAAAGDQLYYLFFHTAHEPTAWAPFAVGVRDVQPYNLRVRMLALHGQLYDTDFSNPLLAAFGNFDAAFVLALLCPLFLIAISHNLWSAEREQGTWDLIRSQPTSMYRLLLVKLGVRAVLVLAPMLSIVGLAVGLLGLPVDIRLLSVAALVMIYVALWLGVVLVVVALKRSSDFTLAVLLTIWVLSSVLGPALVNAVAAARFPVPEALELTVRQRQGYHAAWDQPLDETMARFYARYPAWRNVAIPRDTYSNGWYYAMQQRGDDEARGAAEAYVTALRQRQAWTDGAAAWCPPAVFQRALAAIARTDVDSHLAYLASVAAWHEALKQYFFPAVFHHVTIGQVNWAGAPRHRFIDEGPATGLRLQTAVLTAAALVALAVGLMRLKRQCA
jgi:ABC-2 type transport system permease protein